MEEFITDSNNTFGSGIKSMLLVKIIKLLDSLSLTEFNVYMCVCVCVFLCFRSLVQEVKR